MVDMNNISDRVELKRFQSREKDGLALDALCAYLRKVFPEPGYAFEANVWGVTVPSESKDRRPDGKKEDMTPAFNLNGWRQLFWVKTVVGTQAHRLVQPVAVALLDKSIQKFESDFKRMPVVLDLRLMAGPNPKGLWRMEIDLEHFDQVLNRSFVSCAKAAWDLRNGPPESNAASRSLAQLAINRIISENAAASAAEASLSVAHPTIKTPPVEAILESLDTPGEAGLTNATLERFDREISSHEVVQREAALVAAFVAFLRCNGSSFVLGQLYAPGENLSIYSDLVDLKKRVLWEAKGSSDRGSIRMALGQLADYRRFEKNADRIGVLLPGRPLPDLVRLILEAGADLAWQNGNTFVIERADRRIVD